jgi:spoIIIJ-associated protein
MDNNEDKSNEAEDGTSPEDREFADNNGRTESDSGPDTEEKAGAPDEDSGVWDVDNKPLTPEALEKIAEQAKGVVQDILKHFPHVESPNITSRVEDDSIWVEIEGDPTGRLIGRRGQTIDAFQHLMSKIISHKLRKRISIHVDAENYKRRNMEKLKKLRNMEKLKKLAVQTADYVASTGSARALEPMSPADRRIVHLTLRDREDVMTVSEGRNPNRFVVVWPSDEQNE